MDTSYPEIHCSYYFSILQQINFNSFCRLVSLTATTDQEEEMDVTYIGGKKFQRVKVHQRSNVTPGVRRSKRRRIAPIQPGEHLEYQIHCGVTPSKSYGQLAGRL